MSFTGIERRPAGGERIERIERRFANILNEEPAVNALALSRDFVDLIDRVNYSISRDKEAAYQNRITRAILNGRILGRDGRPQPLSKFWSELDTEINVRSVALYKRAEFDVYDKKTDKFVTTPITKISSNYRIGIENVVDAVGMIRRNIPAGTVQSIGMNDKLDANYKIDLTEICYVPQGQVLRRIDLIQVKSRAQLLQPFEIRQIYDAQKLFVDRLVDFPVLVEERRNLGARRVLLDFLHLNAEQMARFPEHVAETSGFFEPVLMDLLMANPFTVAEAERIMSLPANRDASVVMRLVLEGNPGRFNDLQTLAGGAPDVARTTTMSEWLAGHCPTLQEIRTIHHTWADGTPRVWEGVEFHSIIMDGTSVTNDTIIETNGPKALTGR